MNTLSLRPLVVFTTAIFTSATLLFLVQPMVGKMLLPKFGGTPAVWSTCMVFFQAALLAGYAYAHYLSTQVPLRQQVAVHSGALALPLLAFVLFPLHAHYQRIDPSSEGMPALQVLLLLTQLIGVPFLLVSTSAPLLQRWFSQTADRSAQDPYFLYAASNLGSMLALFLYPILIEPRLSLATQGALWMAGYGLLGGLTVACGLVVARTSTAAASDIANDEPPSASTPNHPDALSTEQSVPQPNTSEQLAASVEKVLALPTHPPTLRQQLHWIALAFIPSSLMLGVTTYMTMDISALPLLWLPPLTLYLLSFILVFSRLTAPIHPFMVLCFPVAVLLMVFLTISDTHPWIVWQFLIHLAVLFVVAMVCHGELAQRRPAPEHLTRFYLCMSIGGVLGGLFNALVAPHLFYTVAEYFLVLTLACLFLPPLTSEKQEANRLLEGTMLIVLAGFCLVAAYQHYRDWLAGDVELMPHLLRPLPGLNPGPLHGLVPLAVAAALIVYLARSRAAERWQRSLDILLPVLLGLVAAQFLMHYPLPVEWFKEEWFTGIWTRRNLEPPDAGRVAQVLTCTLLVVIAYGFCVRPVRFTLTVGALLLVHAWQNVPANVVVQQRSFFCVYRVETARYQYGYGHYNKLVHGTTMHGQQRLDSEPLSVGAALAFLAGTRPLPAATATVSGLEVLRERRNEPLTYFHRTGPIGQVFETLVFAANDRRPIAVLGLGTGTLAGYIQPSQRVTFYEIDPLAIQIARDPRCFTYLRDCRGQVEVVLGDGRLKLKEAPNGHYRLLFMDAFSSDSIPIHLVTREAIRLYFDKLTADGVLVVNVSNRYLRPAPVLANIAHDLGLVALKKWDYGDDIPGKAASDWVVMARQRAHLGRLIGSPGWEELTPDPSKPLWTDDFSNLISILQ